MNDPLGLLEGQGQVNDPLGLLTPKDDSYLARVGKALPEMLEGSAGLIGKVPGMAVGGLGALGALATGEGTTRSREVMDEISHSLDPTRLIPGHEDRTKDFNMMMEAATEQAGQTGMNLVGAIPGMGQGLTNEFEPAIRSGSEAALNFMPIPGAKIASKAVHAPIEKAVNRRLMEDLQNQEYTNPDKIDPLTQGAKPAVEAWEPSGQKRLPLQMDPLGLMEQGTHYESGLPPDAYLKGRMEPTGQGDLFAGTKPYKPEELGAQASEGRAAIARAQALAIALEFERTGREKDALTTRSGYPEIEKEPYKGQPRDRSMTQTEIPTIEPRNPGLESGISFKGNPEPSVRNTSGAGLDMISDIESGRSGKTFANDPHQTFPTADGSGIVKMGNGGHIDWAKLMEVGKTTIDLAGKGLKILMEHSPNGITPHGNVTLKIFNSTSGKHIGGADIQLKNPYDPIEGNKIKISNIAVDKDNASKRAGLEVAKIAQQLGDLELKSAGSTGDGQRLASVMQKRAERESFPGSKDGMISMANGGFISPEFTQKAIDFAKTAIMGKERNMVEGMKEAGKLLALDRRTPDEVIKSIDLKNIEDISTLTKVTMNALDSSGIIEATKNYSGSNQLIKWQHDMLKLTDRTIAMIKEDLLKGTEFIKGLRGFEMRTTAADSPVKLMQTEIKRDWQSTREMLKTWFEAAREGVEPHFENMKHQEIYDSWQKVFDYTREHMNELRSRMGLPPIAKAEGYFPMMRMGDWRITIQDSNKNLMGAFHAPTRAFAEALKAKLAKELPELSISDINHLEKSKYDYRQGDFTALEAANKALKDQPDVYKAVQQAYADVMKHRGFGGKHAVESQHILGAMGLDSSRKGSIDALKAFEMYTERSMDYIGNLQKKERYANMEKAIGEAGIDPKNTLSLMRDMLDHSTTSLKNKLEIADDVLNTIGRISGFGEQGFRSKLRQGGAVVNAWLLSTGSFIMSQIVQPATGLAGLAISEGGGLKGTAYAGKDAIIGLAKTLMPGPEEKLAVSYAAKHGYISPAFAELYGARHAEGGIVSAQKALSAFSLIGQKLETEFVRIPYFLMQVEALKDQYKGESLYEAAGERTDHYMVNYDKGNHAMMWQRLGAVGELAKPLKQFSNNFLGQFMEYSREAKGGDLAPMALMLGTSIALAGLTGNIVVQTADDVVRGLNAIGASAGKTWNIPTTQELVMKSGQSDMLTFGLGSTILGNDVSSSVAQNSMKSMLSIPLASVGTKTLTDVWPYFWNSMHGTDTTVDRAKALLAVTPPGARESLKDLWVKDGIVPDLNHNMEKLYQRTPEEQSMFDRTKAGLVGRPGLNEARMNNIIRYTRESLRENMADKKSASNVIADKIINGEAPSPEDFQRYITEGGDPKGITSVVKNRLLAKDFDIIERTYMKKGLGGYGSTEAIKEESKAKGSIQKQGYEDDHFQTYMQGREVPKSKPMNDATPLPAFGYPEQKMNEVAEPWNTDLGVPKGPKPKQPLNPDEFFSRQRIKERLRATRGLI